MQLPHSNHFGLIRLINRIDNYDSGKYCLEMSKSIREPTTLFRPFIVAGIILVSFGIFCIWIGTSVISFQEGGEGFKIIGTRFLIGGVISIILGLIAKYHLLIKYLLKQFSYKRRSQEDKRSDWYKP